MRRVDPLPYSFANEAAFNARADSRRYWAKGGEADKKYPRNKTPGWFAPRKSPPEQTVEEAIARMKGHRPLPSKED